MGRRRGGVRESLSQNCIYWSFKTFKEQKNGYKFTYIVAKYNIFSFFSEQFLLFEASFYCHIQGGCILTRLKRTFLVLYFI